MLTCGQIVDKESGLFSDLFSIPCFVAGRLVVSGGRRMTYLLGAASGIFHSFHVVMIFFVAGLCLPVILTREDPTMPHPS